MSDVGATWFLAICHDCDPVLPQPFRTADARDEWGTTHIRNGHCHTVKLTEEPNHGIVMDEVRRMREHGFEPGHEDLDPPPTGAQQ